MKVFLNADVGEGASHDHEIIPLVDAVNISCGAHAGSDEDIHTAIQLAVRNACRIGAHPGYPDPENYGRLEIEMPQEELKECLIEQLNKLDEMVQLYGGLISYIKPHGALYNRISKDEIFAKVILGIFEEWRALPVMLLAGSVGCKVASKGGGIAEGFLDRAYTDDGLLVPRGEANAVISEENQMKRQTKAMLSGKPFPSISSTMIQVKVDSVCVHGDTPNVVDLLKAVLTSKR